MTSGEIMNHTTNNRLWVIASATLAFFLAALPASAQTNAYTEFGNYKVYHSVFNSTFISAEIAELHGFTRAANQALINVALIHSAPEGDSLGLRAQVSGQAQNLIQQSKPLNFVEIRDGDAVYYLASFRFDDEEPLHFTVNLDHEGTSTPYEIKFTKTLYRD